MLNLDKTITHEYERETWFYDKDNYWTKGSVSVVEVVTVSKILLLED